MDLKETKTKVKKLLSEFLGVEIDDINDDDDFTTDLQMEPTQMSDFQEKLRLDGVEVDDIDFNDASNINELSDLIVEGVVTESEISEE